MKRQIIDFLYSDILWKQIIGTLIATGVIWIIAIIYGVVTGLNYQLSIQSTIDILSRKVSCIWIIILFLGFIIMFRRNNLYMEKKIKEYSFSKTEIINKLTQKTDLHLFERFQDIYDYRRLKNHPWHDQYINDDISSFLQILKSGLEKKDGYKIENALAGLSLEINIKGWIHSSVKNDIMKELIKYSPVSYCHHKVELEKILESVKIV